MARRYEAIWENLKKIPVGQEVQVKCHATFVNTLKQAVMKEKSRETALREKLGMEAAGKMQIRTEPAQPSGFVCVFFKLTWDESKI
jgi:hypothetical protein